MKPVSYEQEIETQADLCVCVCAGARAQDPHRVSLYFMFSLYYGQASILKSI